MKNFSKTSKFILATALALPFLCLVLWTESPGPSAQPHDTYKSLETFSNVLSLIQKNYVENVDTTDVLQGAIKGMLASLDPHSSYLKPDDFKELKLETKGSFTGIGIEITIKDNILTVVSPIEGTPGYKAGLKAGDKILKIENELTKDMSLMDAVKKLRGPKDTEVHISLHREGWTKLREMTIVRGLIPLHSVKSKTLEPGYIYLRITNFQNQTTKDFKKALKDLSSKGRVSGLIIDLRNNPGGLLAQSVKISDVFIKEGVIVSTKGRVDVQNTVYEARSGGTVEEEYPIIVLVNEGSASASEIVAGALQDHKRALIVGTQTFGKGSVQTIIPMSNGAGLRLTTARYYTPSGRSIQALGITPDIIVENTPIVQEENGEENGKPTFLREKDLTRHFENPNGSTDKKESKPAETDQESSKPDDSNKSDSTQVDEPKSDKVEMEQVEKEAQEIKELLNKDNQLKTALMLLKGLNVYTSFKQQPPQ
ncbi:MAG: S41 family peptidase [Proteobacteria bacterium]|nr:S41 family peptidase [Pseudomonadota bacterium]MBU1686822.1 S41 family peptidase [Pseudomonadota bacterium]